MAVTIPAPSCPPTTGRTAGKSPVMLWSSLWHSPANSSLTRTSPGLGSASVQSTISQWRPTSQQTAARVLVGTASHPFQRTPRPAKSSVQSLMNTDLSSVKLSSDLSPSSRPMPDCLNPPNGNVESSSEYVLTHTTHARRFLARVCAVDTLLVATAAASPYSVSLAMRTASSTSRKPMSAATGPKISSRARRMSLRTSVNTVGSTKYPALSNRPPPRAISAPSLTPSDT